MARSHQSLQGEGRGLEMPGECMPTLLLCLSQLMLGGGERRKRNSKSFLHPLPGPLPGLRSPSRRGWGCSPGTRLVQLRACGQI